MPEVAKAFRRFAGSYLAAHGAAMLPSHRRAIADIIACRTEALGGQQWCCNHCGALLHVFHFSATSSADPEGFSLGISQDWFTSFESPVWDYEGEFAQRVGWLQL